jgi:O-antigen/teichoic acid export membrane protein
MGSRLFRRRLATAALVYAATVLGVLGTIVAARTLGPESFGLLALALAASAFVQILLDTTVEEAIVKYGYRYATASDWGRLRQLFRVGIAVKWAGGALAAAIVALLAPFADAIFSTDDLFLPMLIAAAIPLVQAPEGMAGAVLMVRGRYDLRAAFMALSMGLRLVGVAIGAQLGVVETVLAYVVAQTVASAAVGVAGWRAARAYPAAGTVPLGEDARGIRGFVLRSALGTSFVAARTALAPLALGVVSSPTQVAYFRAAQAPLTGFAALSAPVRLIMFAEGTRDVEAGRLDRAWRSVWRYSAAALAVCAVAVPTGWFLLPWLVPLVFGDAYEGAVRATQLLLLAAAVHLVLGWTKAFPVSIGRPGLRVVTHGVEIAVLLPLVLLLGSRHDATGAAGAYLVASLAFAAAWIAIVARLRALGPGAAPHGAPS